MSPIAILLLALSSYNGTPSQCLNVTSSLVRFELDYYTAPAFIGTGEYPAGNIDDDAKAIKKFYHTCVKRNPKHKGKK